MARRSRRASASPGQELAILVEDAGAAYPLTIDPLMTSPAWTAESDQASALYGVSVATAGDVNGDGYSDVIVGRRGYDNGQADEGRAFVYHGSPAGLSTTAAWTAEGNQANAQFGFSVATAGDVNGDGYSDVIVGARAYDNGQADEGRAFVFHGSPAGSRRPPPGPPRVEPGQRADSALGGDGGGRERRRLLRCHRRRRSVRQRSRTMKGEPTSTTAPRRALADRRLDRGEQPGRVPVRVSVATAGDVNGDGFSDVIVGALSSTTTARPTRGGPSSTTARRRARRDRRVDRGERTRRAASCGCSVATAGDVNGDGFSDVIVGADFYDERSEPTRGEPSSTTAQRRDSATIAAWTAESNQAGACFGVSVATAGDVNGDGFSDVIVGACSTTTARPTRGGLRLPRLSRGSRLVRRLDRRERTRTARFGVSVATAGDVNGDGFSDVIVGADRYDNGQTDEGRAFVYHGSARALAASAAWTAESNQAQRPVRLLGGDGGGRERRRLLRRHRRRPSLRQRSVRRGAGLRLPRLGRGARDHPRLDRGGQPVDASSATRWRPRGM